MAPRRRFHRVAGSRHTVALAVTSLALTLSACVAEPAEPRPTPTAGAAFVPEAAGSPGDGSPRGGVGELTDAEVNALLKRVICWYDDPSAAAACLPPGPDELDALETMALSADARFIAPLVDMLWLGAGWDRVVREALVAVSGGLEQEPIAWYGWLTAERPPLPTEYAQWKGRLLALVDEGFTQLITGELGETLPVDQIIWSRTRIDGTPPLVDPVIIHRVEERYLDRSDRVFGVMIDGEARAYPERILAWHRVVHDTLAGEPIVIVHCTPCGSISVFGATANNGRSYEFGNSALVLESKTLLFDRDTFSLWDPVGGRAIGGPLASAGVRLSPLPVTGTTWQDWSERQPDTTVMALDTGHVRDYDEGAGLNADPIAREGAYPLPATDPRLEPDVAVVGVEIASGTRAYPLSLVESRRIVHDDIGGREIVLVSYGPGLGVVVFDAADVAFTALEGAGSDRVLVDEDEVAWFLDEESLVNSRNSRERAVVASRIASWFAWHHAVPATSIWSP